MSTVSFLRKHAEIMGTAGHVGVWTRTTEGHLPHVQVSFSKAQVTWNDKNPARVVSLLKHCEPPSAPLAPVLCE